MKFSKGKDPLMSSLYFPEWALKKALTPRMIVQKTDTNNSI
jgi:hypothetical protein